MPRSALLADVGATNARFAIVAPGRRPRRVLELRDEEYPRFADAVAAALAALGGAPPQALIAAAGPVRGGTVRLTNQPWTISGPALARRFGWRRVHLVNDFAAVARALPHLRGRDVVRLGASGRRRPGAPMAVLGPGTGLGVAALLPGQNGWTVAAGEGGHASLAPADPAQLDLLAALWPGDDHVSCEDVLSGPGLARLYRAMAATRRRRAGDITPEAVTRAAKAGEPLELETVRVFASLLGGAAGNLALTYGAEGGVFVAGGIVPALGPLFDRAAFRAAFEAKGRMRGYLAGIPTFLVAHRQPALLGLSALLAAEPA